MWTCDVIAALGAFEKEVGVCCVESVTAIPYTSIIQIYDTDRHVWYYDFNEKKLERMA